jgi:nitrogenase molybdenum-iron protein NifN
VVLPDLGDSLDGHLIDQDSTPLTLGGTPKAAIAALSGAAATVVIGRSLHKAADLLRARSGVPDCRFDHLLGLDACDAFTLALSASLRASRYLRRSSVNGRNCRTRWSTPIS